MSSEMPIHPQYHGLSKPKPEITAFPTGGIPPLGFNLARLNNILAHAFRTDHHILASREIGSSGPRSYSTGFGPVNRADLWRFSTCALSPTRISNLSRAGNVIWPDINNPLA
jgi:hypothetical protein